MAKKIQFTSQDDTFVYNTFSNGNDALLNGVYSNFASNFSLSQKYDKEFYYDTNINTGSGNDKVYISFSGDKSLPEKFNIDLGSGDDRFIFGNNINSNFNFNSPEVAYTGWQDPWSGVESGYWANSNYANLVLFAGSGDDYIDVAGQGKVNIDAGTGNDTIYIEMGSYGTAPGAGTAVVKGGMGHDTFVYNTFGADADINLDGGSGNDTFKASQFFMLKSGHVTLNGGLGDDTFELGNDYMGGETLKYSWNGNNATAGNGLDTVKHFVSWGVSHDTLDLSGLLSDQGVQVSATNLIQYVTVVANGANSNLQVDLDGAGINYAMTDMITFVGLTSLNLQDMLTMGNLVL